MGRWLSRSRSAAAFVADRPALWLPGALAWTVTVGWLALAVGVGRPPTVAELTFFGADLFTSGAWPWNALGIGAMLLLSIVVAFALASIGEVAVLGRAAPRPAARAFVLGLLTATPALVAVLIAAIAAFAVAPAEFNAPENGAGPLIRTLLRIGPFVALAIALAVAGSAIHAAAVRLAIEGRSVAGALRDAPPMLARAGAAAVVQAVALLVLRGLSIAVVAILLRVLWAPIGARLASGGIDVAVLLLLVGFVAIWLCLVLAGGALHAWGSVAWTRVLGAPAHETRRHRGGMETHPRS
jgi:hypothetical protein